MCHVVTDCPMCATCLQNTERRYDQVIFEGAKEGVAAQHKKKDPAGGAGGAGGLDIDADAAAQAAGKGVGKAKQAVGQVRHSATSSASVRLFESSVLDFVTKTEPEGACIAQATAQDLGRITTSLLFCVVAGA